MDNLKVSKKSMLDDEPNKILFLIDDLVIDQEKTLDKNTIIEKNVTTISFKITFQVECKGQKPS